MTFLRIGLMMTLALGFTACGDDSATTDAPPGDTPPSDTPPSDTPSDTPPSDTPPSDTPPSDTPPADSSGDLSCADYCTVYLAACTGTDNEYTDEADCLASCNTGAWLPGTATDVGGNTIGCRIYHAGVAATMSGAGRTTHCGHAGEDGNDTCVTR